MRMIFLITLLGLTACSSIPKLQDLNRISKGMTKAQVISELGEPTSVEQTKDAELLFFNVKDNGEIKPRLVVLKDNEVVFSGRPSAYKATEENSSNGPSIQVNPTISPVFNIGIPTATGASRAPAAESQAVPMAQQASNTDQQCLSSPIYDLNGRVIRTVLNCF